MVYYLWVILLGNIFCPLPTGVMPLQAMDSPEVHDLREGQGPDYIEKLEFFVIGTPRLKYTYCHQPSIFQKDPNHQESLPKIPYTVPDGLVAKVTQEELESFKQCFSSGSDTRHEVHDPSQWPHCVHGHLMMRFEDEDLVVGSGILVGPNHVLTAGHNLYNLNKKQWAKEVWFSPGRKGSYFPFGYSKGCILLCHNQWLDPKSRRKDDYDLGMIILDRAIGNKVGWSGLLCAPNLFFHQGDLTVTGYPGEKGSKDYYSSQMWEKTNRAISQWFSPEKIEYEIPTSFGQSGGAIWRQWPTPINPKLSNILTIGVHTEGNISGKNKGVRLTSEKLDVIIKWIRYYQLKEDHPYKIPQPTSLAVAGTEYQKSADDWWNKGNTYAQDQKDEEAFTCFYTAVKEARDKVPDHMLLKLAECYRQGKGIEQNYLEAFNLYMSVCKLTVSPNIMGWIGTFYLKGLGVPKDVAAGLHFLEEAAKGQNLEAIHTLYYFYSAEGQSHDAKKAEEYQRRAQDHGRPIPNLILEHPDLNHRSWKAVEGDVLDNLYEAPSVVGLIDSYLEGSNKSYLTQLWELLNTNNNDIIPPVRKASISGMGGIGKTSLAARYAHEALANNAYKLIYWIASDTEDKLKESYRKLLDLLDVKVEDTASFSKLLMLLNKKLPKPWLFIYDNVPDARFLDNKALTNGHILITSRCQEGWESPILPLNVFSKKNAVDYLLQNINASTYKIERNSNTEKIAEQIATELGCLPLALSHTVGYISFRKKTLDEYLIELQKSLNVIFTTSKLDPNQKEKKLSHERLIEATWTMAADKISPEAQDLIQYLAYLDPDQIITNIFETKDRTNENIEQSLSELEAYSLIKRSQQKVVSIHRLTQLVLREQQRQQTLEAINTILTSFYNYCGKWDGGGFNDHGGLPDAYKTIKSTIPNLSRVKEHLDDYAQHNNDKSSLNDKLIELKDAHRSLETSFIFLRTVLRNHLLNRKLKISQEISSEGQKPQKSNVSLSYEIIRDEFKEQGVVLTEEAWILLQTILFDDLEIFYNRCEIIRAVAAIPDNERKEVFEKAKELFTKGMQGHIRAAIIKAIAAIPDNERKDVFEKAKELFTEDMYPHHQCAIFQDVAAIPEHRRKDVIEKVKAVIEKGKELYEVDMSGHYISHLIRAVDSIPDHQRNDVIEGANELFTIDMKGYERSVIIRTVATIPEHQRKDVIEKGKELFTQDMDGYGRTVIIKAVAKIPDNERKDVIEKATELFTVDMDGYDRTAIIKAVAKIPDIERKDVIEKANELFTVDMDGYKRAAIIKAVARIPDHLGQEGLRSYSQTISKSYSYQIWNG